MAGFKTHIAGATIASGISANILYETGYTDEIFSIFLFVLGVVATEIPDLDSDTSRPLKIVYSVLSAILPFLILYYGVQYHNIETALSDYYNVNTSIALAIGYVFSFITFSILFYSAIKLTKHRGVFHSVPMALFSASFLMAIFIELNIFSTYKVQLLGLFVFGGVIVHLLIDEIYSLIRFKSSSLGTAFKLYDKENIIGTIFLYASTVFLFFQYKDILF
jgi:hypothetical protein